MASEIVQYQADNGQDIKVTEQDVRDLMAASGSNPQNLTPSEIKAYLRLCQAYRLNPFTKDAYIIKYGNSPARSWPARRPSPNVPLATRGSGDTPRG